jgi:pimeloyl-ACP methyl ester carboxylesterase
MLLRLFRTAFAASLLACLVVSAAANEVTPNAFFAVDPIFNSRTYIEQWGDPDDSPVVLVHGLGDNGARDWRHLAPVLAENFYVIAFDLPGFGRSEKLNALYTPDTYTRFIDWIANQYVKRPFALIGHSMGGAIALNFASAHSQRLTRLILIDAAGVLHRTAFTKHLINEVRLPGDNDNASGENLAALNALLGFSLEDIDRYSSSIDAVLLSPLVRGTLLGGDPRMIAGLGLVQHNFSGRLRQVTVPTLLIWGAEDNVAPLRTGRLLAHRLPEARLEIIEGVGHMPMYQSAQRLNQLVLDELNDATDRDPGRPQKQVFANMAESESCDGESNRYISGRYTRVNIVNCKRVLIEDSKIDWLVIRNSSVEILTSEIAGDEVAMEVHDSVLVATAADFTAERPIFVSGSRLDLAGVKIMAGEEPFQVDARSTVLFSVSHVRTPEYARFVHGVFNLSPDTNPF